MIETKDIIIVFKDECSFHWQHSDKWDIEEFYNGRSICRVFSYIKDRRNKNIHFPIKFDKRFYEFQIIHGLYVKDIIKERIKKQKERDFYNIAFYEEIDDWRKIRVLDCYDAIKSKRLLDKD